ncbi:MAG: restriction endonuclease subunit S [Bacteroidota bacterium]
MASTSERWRKLAVGEMVELVQYGSSAKTSEDTSGVPVLRMGNIQDGKLDLNSLKYLPHEHPEFPELLLSEGDLLFNRTNSAELVGKSVVYRGNPPKCSCASYLIRVRLKPEFVPEYLCNYLNSPFGRQWIASVVSQQVGQANVNGSKLKALSVSVPGFDDQRRIVAEIEKQFTRLEAGVAALRRAQANLKRYRAAVLKAACEGRLVPTEAELARAEGRPFESAKQLLARTQAPPRPNRWNSRSQDVIPGHSALAVGNPKTKVPEGWEWSALVEIAKMESGHTPSRNHPEWWDGDVAWIGIADARERDGRTIHETFQHTNVEGIANSASRLLPSGTVCISRTASVGYVVVMGREMATSQDFVNWVPTPAVTSDWLRIIFSADREALRRFGKGSVHKTIYFPEWLSMLIALPPLAEQIRIVAEAERRLSVVDELEALVTANLQRATRLRQSILQKAFAGKLELPMQLIS